MKKVLIILMCSLLLVGCGKNDEKKEMLYKSLEKAYISIYSSDGVGLAVYDKEVVTVDDKNWYMVAITDYSKLGNLISLANNVYEEKLADQINTKINQKYKEIDGQLYTTGEGGECALEYKLDENLRENIKNDIKITKIGINKIKFEYKDKEYTAKKSGKYYKFDEKVFECPKED